MELKNIAILGPRGSVGKAVIEELLKEATRFNITAICRPDSTYTAPPNSSIDIKTADFSSLDSLVAAFANQDAIVNCISPGATQYAPGKLVIDAAIAASVQFFFANEFVGHVTSPQFRRLPEAFVGAKIRIREYLEDLGHSGKISWTSLNGGPFFDMWLMKGPAGFDIPNKRARIYGTGENPLSWTPLPVMARAVVNILRNPEPVRNSPVYICPFRKLTQNAILEAVQRVLGTQFEVEKVDIAKINENARIALERGEVGKAMKGLAVSNQFYEGDSGGDFGALVRNDVVGVEEMSVEDAVRDAIERYGTEGPVVEAFYGVQPCEI